MVEQIDCSERLPISLFFRSTDLPVRWGDGACYVAFETVEEAGPGSKPLEVSYLIEKLKASITRISGGSFSVQF